MQIQSAFFFRLVRPLGLALLVAAIASSSAPSQALTPKNREIPELELTMDLDRNTPGLEQLYHREVRRPTPPQCIDPNAKQKPKQDVLVQYELAIEGSKAPRKLMFEHRIGTDLAIYWVRHIREVRHLNQDGNPDLVFYAGDDTSDDTVILLLKKDHVKAIYTGDQGFSRVDRSQQVPGTQFDDRGQPASKWDPAREVFVGQGILWTTRDCVTLRRSPHAQGEVVSVLRDAEVVTPLEQQGNWQKVRWFGDRTGWIETRDLSNTSPTRIFPLK
jgi:hypothetical protein